MSHRTLSGQFDPIQAHEEKLFRDLTSAPEPFDASRQILTRQRLGKKPGSQGTLFDVESDSHYEGRKQEWEDRDRDRWDRAGQAADLLGWRQQVTEQPRASEHVENGVVVTPEGISMVHARDLRTRETVGSLSWFSGKPQYDSTTIDGGVIHKVFVRDENRRQGIATAMLNAARKWNPDRDIRHSNALTEDGKAWAKARP